MLFKINYKLSQFHSHVVVNCKLGLLYAKSIWDNLRNNCETYFVCVYIQIRARTPSHAVHLKHTFAQLSLQIGQLLLLTTTIYCITAVKLQNCTFSHTNARTYTHSVTHIHKFKKNLPHIAMYTYMLQGCHSSIIFLKCFSVPWLVLEGVCVCLNVCEIV